MFSFDTGLPIAKIIDPNNKKNKEVMIRYDANVSRQPSKPIKKNDIWDLLGQTEVLKRSGSKRMDENERSKIEQWLYENEEPDDTIRDKYRGIKDDYDSMNGKEIVLHTGNIVPYPTTKENQRDVIYISAPSGSGKSTWVSMYVTQYKKQFPKNKIFMFSRVTSDESIDSVKPIRIKLDQDIVDDPITTEELKDSLCIFDDCDTIQDKEIKNAIIKLRNDLLETGRHTRTYILATSHLLMNYKETRTLLNEATSVVVFPSSGSHYHINRFMKVYAGMNNQQIAKALALPSRWVMVHKSFPQYILYSSGIYLLNG